MDLNLTKLPWYAQIGIVTAIAAAAVAAFHYQYEVPTREAMAAREQELASLRREIAVGTTTARKLPEFQTQVGELERRLSDLKAVLPAEKDAADLLRRLQTLATQANLTIRSFKPAPVVTKQLHAEWPINLELDGTYHNLATFFDRLGSFTRIVNVSALDVKGKEKPEPNSTIGATCVATTFVLLDKPQPAPAKAPGAPAPSGAKGT
jgi:type IV pilus assembly protein PilO